MDEYTADGLRGVGVAVDFRRNIHQLRRHAEELKSQLAEFSEAMETSRRWAQAVATTLRAPTDHGLPASMRSSHNVFSPAPKKEKGCILTKREQQVVRLVSLGCTTTEIGSILGISESTADNAKSRAVKRLGVGKAALVTRLALLYGISSPDDRLSMAELEACEESEKTRSTVKSKAISQRKTG